MSLLTLWKDNQEELETKEISQLVRTAGNGKLSDGNVTSGELREFLAAVSTATLARYVQQCLDESFESGGLVLQDLVNELGARLGCSVVHGLYRGKVNAVGFDGIWKFPDSYSVVAEVKTTDAYSIPLGRIAEYRRRLITDGSIAGDSSILIIVGRNDTNELEAQIRGSRFAWDIRLISIEKLLKLVEIKESADNKETLQKIRKVLTPIELTRVDFIVDLLSTTAEDIKDAIVEEPAPEDGVPVKRAKKFTPVAFQVEVLRRVAIKLGVELKKETRTLYATADGNLAVRALASRPHEEAAGTYYWYAFHTYYMDPLKDYKRAFVAFGCGGPNKVLLFDLSKFVKWIPQMNTTATDEGSYSHVHFLERKDNGRFELRLKGRSTAIDVTEHLLVLES
jgi:hypothetical protein